MVEDSHSDDYTIFNDTMQAIIYIPEWSGEICIRPLNGAERDIFLSRHRNADHAHGYLLVHSLVSGEGKRLFSDNDIPAVEQKSSRAVGRIVQCAYALNGFGEHYTQLISEQFRSDNEYRFWFELALILGGRTVRELQQAMDGREFQEWMIYNSIWPMGERRADLRAGIVASVIANVNRGTDTPAFHPSDFIPQFDAVPEEDEAGDADADIALTQSLFESLTLQLGGTIQE